MNGVNGWPRGVARPLTAAAPPSDRQCRIYCLEKIFGVTQGRHAICAISITRNIRNAATTGQRHEFLRFFSDRRCRNTFRIRNALCLAVVGFRQIVATLRQISGVREIARKRILELRGFIPVAPDAEMWYARP